MDRGADGATDTVTGGAAAQRGLTVQARNLTKIFPRGRVVALEDVSFEVRHGQFTSVVGPSGCGKSTLLRLVAGLISRTSGSILVHDSDVTGPRTDIAVMFQRPILLPWKTALENVVLPRKIRGQTGEDVWREGRDLLRLLALEDFEHAFPQHLSGGMQQRVALARLLITGAGLLLMDEPFASLDEFTRERLNLELLRIRSEVDATILFVTHNITEAVFLADQVLVMTPRPGRLAGVVDVPFARRREVGLLRSQEFHDLAFKVRGLLGEAV
jgi:NitT/TauT family transport system ATP-binding protein